jgi:membrane protein implicated in regulation of membrane protease activity
VKTSTRYYLLQIPGWVLLTIILTMIHRWIGLPLWAVASGLALLVIKDIVLYPYLRRAYESASPSGAERFIGEVGTVVRVPQPQGYIRIGGELWQARLDQPSETVETGSRVRVKSVDGLVLIVSRETD